MENSSKICPKCNQESSGELEFCPFDGTRLHQNTFDNFCLACEKQYSDEFQACPVHGEKLTPFTLPPAILEVEYDDGDEVMDEKALDSFSRGLCPKCGAWKNWEELGSEYTCQSCMESFTYQDGQLRGSKTKTVLQVERERLETLPYASVLSAIDEGNKKHWLREFEKFDSSPNYRNWNWPSFFFGPNRYLWKGMWKKGVLVYVVLFSVDIILAFLEPPIPAYSNNPLSSGGTTGPLSLVAGILIQAYLGTSGSKDYYRFVKSFDGDSSKAKSTLTISRVIFFIAVALNVMFRIMGDL